MILALAAVITLHGGSITDALVELMRQRHIQIMFRYGDLGQYRVKPMSGDGSVAQVLDYILKDTDYTWSRGSDAQRTITIHLRSECRADCEPLDG